MEKIQKNKIIFTYFIKGEIMKFTKFNFIPVRERERERERESLNLIMLLKI